MSQHLQKSGTISAFLEDAPLDFTEQFYQLPQMVFAETEARYLRAGAELEEIVSAGQGMEARLALLTFGLGKATLPTAIV